MTRRFAATIAGAGVYLPTWRDEPEGAGWDEADDTWADQIVSRELTWADEPEGATWADEPAGSTWADQQRPFEIDIPTISKRLGEQGTCTFRFLDVDGTVDLEQGMLAAVWLEDGDTRTLLHRGLVDEPELEPWSTFGRLWQVDLRGFNVLAERRVVAEAYHDTDVATIVSDLADRYLADDGVTVDIDPAASDITVRSAVLNYIYLDQALDRIAERAGMWWRIDESRVLHLQLQTSRQAPFDVEPDTDDGAVSYVQNFRRRKVGPDYRNRQLIRGVRDVTDPLTERFRADGDQRTFTVGFPIALQPDVTVEGTPQVVGVRGIDDDDDTVQWYWSKGSQTLTQDDDETPLASGDLLEVVYRGHIDMVVRVTDEPEVAERAGLELTGGVWERLSDDPDVEGRLDAFELAAAKLDKWAQIGHQVSYRTHRTGLEPGQLQRVRLLDFGIDEDVLIEEVSLAVQGLDVGWQVEAVRGPVSDSWRKIFARIMELPKRSLTFRENIAEDETLTLLFDFDAEWSDADEPVNIYREVYPRDGLFPSDSLFPMFDPELRVRFLEVYDTGGALLHRAQVTLTDQVDEGELFSSVLLLAQHANGDVGEVAWFGGWQATTAAGSGVEIGRENVGETKTAAEAWQIDRTDRRDPDPDGWWIT